MAKRKRTSEQSLDAARRELRAYAADVFERSTGRHWTDALAAELRAEIEKVRPTHTKQARALVRALEDAIAVADVAGAGRGPRTFARVVGARVDELDELARQIAPFAASKRGPDVSGRAGVVLAFDCLPFLGLRRRATAHDLASIHVLLGGGVPAKGGAADSFDEEVHRMRVYMPRHGRATKFVRRMRGELAR